MYAKGEGKCDDKDSLLICPYPNKRCRETRAHKACDKQNSDNPFGKSILFMVERIDIWTLQPVRACCPTNMCQMDGSNPHDHSFQCSIQRGADGERTHDNRVNRQILPHQGT